jgi:hypothetical protein
MYELIQGITRKFIIGIAIVHMLFQVAIGHCNNMLILGMVLSIAVLIIAVVSAYKFFDDRTE